MPPGPELLIAALLLVTSHSTPAVTGSLLGPRWGWPIDGGLELRDGHRLFGATKTWRGLVLALGASSLATMIVLERPWIGFAFAALAMAGDLASSFIKRRRGLPPHADVLFLDQLPESVLPLVVMREPLAMSWLEVAVVIVVFIPANILANRGWYGYVAKRRGSLVRR